MEVDVSISFSFVFQFASVLKGTFWIIFYLIFLFHICPSCISQPQSPKVERELYTIFILDWGTHENNCSLPHLSPWPETLTLAWILGKVVLDFITADGYLAGDVLGSLHALNATMNHHNIIIYYFHFAGW